MTYLSKELEKCLLKLVQKESWADWSKTPNPESPKYVPTEVVENKPGWYNIIKQALMELRP